MFGSSALKTRSLSPLYLRSDLMILSGIEPGRAFQLVMLLKSMSSPRTCRPASPFWEATFFTAAAFLAGAVERAGAFFAGALRVGVVALRGAGLRVVVLRVGAGAPPPFITASTISAWSAGAVVALRIFAVGIPRSFALLLRSCRVAIFRLLEPICTG